MLGVVGAASLILGNLVFSQKSGGAKVCAAVALAALLGALAIGGRRWWRERKEPKRPTGPNYDRTPYV